MAAIAVTRLVVIVGPLSSLTLPEHFALSSYFHLPQLIATISYVCIYLLECVVYSWIYGSIWITPPLFGWSHFIFEGFGTSCTFDYISKDEWNRLFIMLLVIGGFLIPLMIIIVSYTFILRKLSKRSRRFLSQDDDRERIDFPLKQSRMYHYMTGNSVNSAAFRTKPKYNFETIRSNKIARIIHRTEVRATRTALLVCAIYCIAWTPYTLMAILSQIGFDHLVSAYTTSTLDLFSKTAACVNTLIYALSSSVCRQHICFFLKYSCVCPVRSHRLRSSYYDLNRRQ